MEQEEGFNLAIRRMLRTSNTYYVMLIAYSNFSFMRKNHDLLQLLQNTTEDTVLPHGGTIYQMRRGDQFVVFNEAVGEKVATLAANITAAAFPDRKPGCEDDEHVLTRIFHIPQDYLELRRTTSIYLDATGTPMMALAPAPAGTGTADPKSLKEEPDGPLNAWTLSRIETLLAETDLAPYIRSQTVYELDPQGRWQRVFDEYFTSIADLARDKFPKVDLHPGDRMFMELCRALDRRSIPEIIRRNHARPGRRFSLNIGLSTFTGPYFTKLIHDAPQLDRKSMILEINRSDLMHQPRATAKALKIMREAEVGIALDGITLDLLGITNLQRVDFDYIKIVISPSTMWLLRDSDCLASLKKLPREKIILCHCEKDSVLPVGKAFNLNKYQGWIIDKLASGGADAESAPSS